MKTIKTSVVIAETIHDLNAKVNTELELREQTGFECWGMSLAYNSDNQPSVIIMFEAKK